MTSPGESSSFRRFFQYVEDSGLRTYDGLVIQNASDISRESDRIRNQTNWTYLQEKHHKKKRQEEAIKRIEDDVARATDAAYSGKHFRMGFMTMPAPQDRLPPPSQGFTVRSQSLHSVGGGEEDSNMNRKQPPPKPRRDPNTKLSSSSEAVGGVSGVYMKTQETSEQADARAGEDCRKLPPPKPRRNPNTQLSMSFDESHSSNHGNKKTTQSLDRTSNMDFEEPVYIEMVGNILRELKGQQEFLDDEQSEAVYEEMKYPLLEDLLQDPRLDMSGQTTMLLPDSRSYGTRGSLCDIPPPFPNLLTPRPPLLVFPSAPAQCSPNSDESPLTPLEVAQLPVIDKASFNKSGAGGELSQVSSHRKERDRTHARETSGTPTITASGRSSAPPLPSTLYKSSGSAHSGHGYPRSQSACPSPVSMGRCLTPLSLKRPPPYDTLMGGGSIPRSSSSSHRVQEDGLRFSGSSSSHGSMQNISMRPQTPTSPLEDLNNLFTSSRAVKKKGCDRRRSRDGDDCRRNRPDSKDRDMEGRSSPVSSRMGRHSVSPTMMMVGSEAKSGCKLGRSASTSGVPSPRATPQRHPQDHPVLSQMPWLCGDATMMEIIERKRVLCREIKARQRPEKNLCKQESMPILPSWSRRQPPPYLAPHGATAGLLGLKTADIRTSSCDDSPVNKPNVCLVVPLN